MTDESTNRQWAEGTSPLCTVREYPMTDEKHKRISREFHMMDDVIEIQGPFGSRTISVPSDWGAHDFATISMIMEAADYQKEKSSNALFSFAPAATPDEEGVFDASPDPFVSRLTMIPGAKVYNVETTATGYRATMYDYATGKKHRVTVDEAQPDLAAVPERYDIKTGKGSDD